MAISTRLSSKFLRPGDTPIIYTKKNEAVNEPPKSMLKSDDSCLIKHKGRDSNCKVRTNFFQAREVPLGNNLYCHGPLTSTMQTSKTVTWTYNGQGQTGWTDQDA